MVISEKKVCVPRHNGSVETKSDNAVPVVIWPNEDYVSLNEEKTTPTRFQMKNEESYKAVKDSNTDPETAYSDSDD